MVLRVCSQNVPLITEVILPGSSIVKWQLIAAFVRAQLPNEDGRWHVVAQIFNLLYRRFVIGRASNDFTRSIGLALRRMQFRDTAD